MTTTRTLPDGSLPTLPYRADEQSAGREQEPVFFGLTPVAWMRISVVTALMAFLFWPNLRRLWDKTNPITGEANWQHAIIIPVVGLYYLYANREQLLKARARAAWSGAVILALGILLFGYGIYPGQNDFVKDFGMVVTLFGVVTLLAGWDVMKIAWFPIAFLICGLPWPGLVYSWIAGPLQHLAARVAVVILESAGINTRNTGTHIIMKWVEDGKLKLHPLNVAEACSGLKSLMTFISLAAAVAFLSARPLWQKLVMVVSAIPIAIFCNVMRVTAQGLFDRFISVEFGEGFAHQFVGIIMLIPALFLILLVGWVLDRLFVDEVRNKSELKARVVLRRAAAGGQLKESK